MAAQIRLQEQNLVLITGRLTRDSVTTYTSKGQAFCRFDVAVNRRYLDQTTNEWKDDTSFVPVVLWGPLAERSKDKLTKGVPVAVEGRLQSSEYQDKTGQTRRGLQINARRVQVLQWQEGGASSSAPASDSSSNEDVSIDDDVPF